MIEAFITNLGKYNEGYLVGEWVSFPTSYSEIQEVFKRISLGGRYEEYFITDYELEIPNLYDQLGEYENLDEINYLSSLLSDMDKVELMKYKVILKSGVWSGRSLKDFINLTYNLDCYDWYEDIDDESDLGYYWIHESGCYDLSSMGTLGNYIDYEAFGRDIALEEISAFTSDGYVVERESTTEPYSGIIEDIDDEFIITKNIYI